MREVTGLNEEKTIEASISEFIRVYNAGNLEGVLAYYSDDLIKIRQGGPAETKAYSFGCTKAKIPQRQKL